MNPNGLELVEHASNIPPVRGIVWNILGQL